MRVTGVLTRVLATLALGAASAAVPVLTAAPAQAAGCSTSSGVTVVVDFNALGGGVQTECVYDGGGSRAYDLFAAAGFEQRQAAREPGFVCRVDEKPASDPCTVASPASAYWSLWWSNGTSGSWTYSSLGVMSLTVPDGGTVAWSWDGESGDAVPSATPRSGSSGSGGGGGGGGGTDGGTGGGGNGDGGGDTSPSDGPTGSPSDDPSDDGSAAPGTGPRDGEGGKRGRSQKEKDGTKDGKKGSKKDGAKDRAGRDDADASSAPEGVSITEADTEPTAAQPADGGLPGWVPPVVVLVLLGVGGATALVRRRAAR